MAAIMIFALTVPAFAAGETVSLNETKSFSFDDYGTRMFSFTPKTTGLYKMNLDLDSCQYLSIYVKTEDSTVLHNYIFGYWFEGFNDESLVFCADGGTEYLIYFILDEMFEDMPAETKVEFSITQIDAPKIKTGVNEADGTDNWLIFAPDKSGFYTFCSDVKADIVPEFYLLKSYYDYEVFRGEDYDDGNFNFTRYFKAGEFYAVRIDAYYDEYELCEEPVSFTVSYEEKLKIECMSIFGYINNSDYDFWGDGDTMKLTNRQGYKLELYLEPDLAVYSTDFSVVSGDESKLIAEYSNENDVLYLNTKKIGRTTLTITADDGTSITVNVKIRSMFIAAVESLFKNISGKICEWFDGIFKK